MKPLGALILTLRFGTAIGIFWYLWGIWGFWWGLLCGLFWEIWFAARVIAPWVLRQAGA